MQLVLTTTTPSNSIYINESGAPKYKVNTPLKLHDRTTAISRISADGHEAEAEEGVQFASLVHINWHLAESSVIRFQGHKYPTHDFFRKVGWGWYGRSHRHRVFTALDGKEYKWILSAYTSQASAPTHNTNFIHSSHTMEQLKMNDDTETLVACYRPKKLGLVHIISCENCFYTSLKVFPQFEHMLDKILVMFVYIERIRKSKERAVRSPTLLNK
ncbi:hypothetical protein B0H17DRAFT_925229 [Mycena rosella]|uniref:DUF6593 domain-containing protein n=1 Tax=Mycena rosella TaxID=1033263 RepID=A0AAD7DVG0_MYCRO|nr:hypothetical protein B0H17DRAFT_925229 [Mycena rosella]